MNVMVNYLAVVVAAVAGFVLGWGWYMLFGKVWKEALGKTGGRLRSRRRCPSSSRASRSLLMAWMLAGLMGHLGNVTVRGGVISRVFRLGRLRADHDCRQPAFQGTKPLVTVIDAGHWLVVLLVMGAIIGAFGV